MSTKFQWEGKLRDGTVKRGVMEAESAEAVTASLRAQAIAPGSVKAKRDGFKLPSMGSGVETKELVVFTRQFATMIDAGLPLVQCLDILGTQQENPKFQAIIMTVKADVEGGSTFSDALAKHPKVFDRLFSNLIAAGEVGGVLDTVMNRLAVYLEKAAALKAKVKGALVYPISVTVVAVGIIVLMLVKVIPVFQKMFEDFGGALPAPTQVVISISEFMQANILYMMVGTALAIAAFKYIYSTQKGRWHFDKLFLRLPIFGSLLRKVAVARFSRTMSTMLSSGVPILDALEIVARTAGNVIVEHAVLQTKASIAEGKTLTEPLEKSGVFPGMVTQMISVGEQTGEMDSMLSKIADFYDEEVETAVEALTSLLEPLLMVFLGGAVGGLLVAMYLPIFKIAETVG